MIAQKQQVGFAPDAGTQEFYEGIVDMFLDLRAGHLGPYCFSSPKDEKDSVRGDEHWTQFIKTSTDYYPYLHQIKIVENAAPTIGKIVADAKTFIDLGTGSLNSFERKVLPILREGKFDEITFVDLCSSFSRLATKRLEQEGFAINTNTFIGNFFNQLPAPKNKAVINLFGITLGNIIVDLPRETPEQVLAKTLQHFAAPLRKHGGYFIFDYDTNEDGASIHATYAHPSYHAMEMTILDRAKRDIPTTDFDPADFEHVTVWYPEWKLLAQELRTKCDVDFTLGDYRISLPQGKSFRTGSSFKYSDATVERAANQAGFKQVDIFTLPNSTMRIAVYEIDSLSIRAK